MNIKNYQYLKNCDIQRINEMSQISWSINKDLTFDISEMTKPKGNTTIEIQLGIQTSSVEIEYTHNDYDKIKSEIEKYQSEIDSLTEQVRLLQTMTEQVSDSTENEYEKATLLSSANILENKAKTINNLIEYTLKPILLGIKRGGTFRMTHTIVKNGEYNPTYDKILLYVENNKNYDSKLLLSTLVHELFHAFYHKHRACTTIREIDEAIVEFSMLSYLDFLTGVGSYDDLLNHAKIEVENKKYGMGQLPAYGYGFYLYEHCGDKTKWVYAYYKRIGNIDGTDTAVKEYVQSLNPSYTNNEKGTYGTLSKILFNRPKKISYVSNPPKKVGDIVKTKTQKNIEVTVIILPKNECAIIDITQNGRITRGSHIDLPSKITHERNTYKITEIRNPVNLPLPIRIPPSIRKIAKGALGKSSAVYIDDNEFEYYDEDRTILKGYSGHLSEITIPHNVISIGPNAFENKIQIKKIVIPQTVIHIWENAFAGCININNLEIPESVVFIGEDAFKDVVNISNKCAAKGFPWGSKIFEGDFEYSDANKTILKKYLGRETSVAIPNTIKKIAINAFEGCYRLKTIDITSPITLIVEQAKDDESSIRDGGFEFGDKGKTILKKYLGDSPNVVIPNTVVAIAPFAFVRSWSNLKSITIPASVKQIWGNAFAGCSKLKNVNIPSTVAFIGKKAFEEIVGISYSGSNNAGFPWGALHEDGGLVYKDASKTHLVRCLSSNAILKIPNSVKDIEYNAFSGCTNLTIHIYDENCYNCRKLFDQRRIATQRVAVFAYADADMSFLIKYYGDTAPDTLPKSVTQIKGNAFNGIVFDNSNYPVTNGFPWGGQFIVDNFEYADADKTVLIKYHGNNSVVYIPKTVKVIGKEAFFSCSGLTNISIPKSVTEIGIRAFKDCSNLQSVEILSDGDLHIQHMAFHSCINLNSVKLCKTDPVDIYPAVFPIRNSNLSLYVPHGSGDKYRNARNWGMIQNIIEY